MSGFDFNGARNAGFNDDEILDYLSKDSNYAGIKALKDLNIPSTDIVNLLTKNNLKPMEGDKSNNLDIKPLDTTPIEPTKQSIQPIPKPDILNNNPMPTDSDYSPNPIVKGIYDYLDIDFSKDHYLQKQHKQTIDNIFAKNIPIQNLNDEEHKAIDKAYNDLKQKYKLPNDISTDKKYQAISKAKDIKEQLDSIVDNDLTYEQLSDEQKRYVSLQYGMLDNVKNFFHRPSTNFENFKKEYRASRITPEVYESLSKLNNVHEYKSITNLFNQDPKLKQKYMKDVYAIALGAGFDDVLFGKDKMLLKKGEQTYEVNEGFFHNLLDDIKASKSELLGYIPGAIAGARAGAGAGVIGAGVGGIIGGAVGAYAGAGIDYVLNNWSLKRQTDNDEMIHHMLEAGTLSLVGDVALAGATKYIIKPAYKAAISSPSYIRKIRQNITNRNINELPKLFESVGVSPQQAKNISEQVDKYIDTKTIVDKPDTFLDKALNQYKNLNQEVLEKQKIAFDVSYAHPQLYREVIGVAQKDPQFAHFLHNAITDRAEKIQINPELELGDIQSAIKGYESSLSKEYGDTIGLFTEVLPEYRFYPSDFIDKEIDNLQRYMGENKSEGILAGIRNQLKDIGEDGIDVTQMIELRKLINKRLRTYKYEYNDKSVLKDINSYIDKSIDEALKQNVKNEGIKNKLLFQWKDINARYAELSDLKDSKLYKDIFSENYNSDRLFGSALSKWIDTKEDLSDTIIGKLDSRMQDKTQAYIIKSQIEKYINSTSNGGKYVDWQSLSDSLGKLETKINNESLKDYIHTLKEMSMLFKHDGDVIKRIQNGEIALPIGANGLSVDYLRKLHTAIVNSTWKKIQSFLPIHTGRRLALQHHIQEAMKQSRTSKDFIFELISDPNTPQPLIKELKSEILSYTGNLGKVLDNAGEVLKKQDEQNYVNMLESSKKYEQEILNDSSRDAGTLRGIQTAGSSRTQDERGVIGDVGDKLTPLSKSGEDLSGDGLDSTIRHSQRSTSTTTHPKGDTEYRGGDERNGLMEEVPKESGTLSDASRLHTRTSGVGGELKADDSGITLESDSTLSPTLQQLTQSFKNQDFGTNYPQYYHKGKEAIEHLLNTKEGQVQGAFYRPDIGDITLVWGEAGTGKSDGFGLSKIAKYHPEVLDRLEDIINKGGFFIDSKQRPNVILNDEIVGLRDNWKGKKIPYWVISSYKKQDSFKGIDSEKAKEAIKEGYSLNNPVDSNPTTQSFKNQDFGTNYPQFYHKGKEAIEHLLKHKQGQVQGAFYKDGLGDIDLVWGDDKMGLKHILNKHPEVIDKIPDIVENGKVVKYGSIETIINGSYKVGLSKGWFGKGNNNWILTAYEDTRLPHSDFLPSNELTISDGNLPLNNLDSNPTTQSFKNQDLSTYISEEPTIGKLQGEALHRAETTAHIAKQFFIRSRKRMAEFQDFIFGNDSLDYDDIIDIYKKELKKIYPTIRDYRKNLLIEDAHHKDHRWNVYHELKEYQREVRGLVNYYRDQKRNIKVYEKAQQKQQVEHKIFLEALATLKDNKTYREAIDKYPITNTIKYQNETNAYLSSRQRKFDKIRYEKSASLRFANNIMEEGGYVLKQVDNYFKENGEPFGISFVSNSKKPLKGVEAINALLTYKVGQAKGAFYKDGLGDIDLVWGDDKMGLKHILNKHPEVIDKIPDIVENGITSIKKHDATQIIKDDYKVVLKSNIYGRPTENKWILTAYEDMRGVDKFIDSTHLNSKETLSKTSHSNPTTTELKNQENNNPIEGRVIKKGVLVDDLANVKEKVEYKIIEEKDLRPNFIGGSGTQFRFADNEQTIAKIVDDFDADLHFGRDGGFDGIPVIDYRGNVVSGNHRAKAIMEIYKDNKQKAYQDGIEEYYGREVLEGFDKPVLVRELINHDDDVIRRIAQVSNQDRTNALSDSIITNAARLEPFLNQLEKFGIFESNHNIVNIARLQGFNYKDAGEAILGLLNPNIGKSINQYLKRGGMPEIMDLLVDNGYFLFNVRNLSKEKGMGAIDLSYLLNTAIDTMPASRTYNSKQLMQRMIDDYYSRFVQIRDAHKYADFIGDPKDFKGTILGVWLHSLLTRRDGGVEAFRTKYSETIQSARDILNGSLIADGRPVSEWDILRGLINNQGIEDEGLHSRLLNLDYSNKYNELIDKIEEWESLTKKELPQIEDKKLNNQDPTKDFGTNYPQFYHKGKEAIEHLLNTKEGQVQGAFYKDGLGDIDLVWGEVTNATKHTGYGLAHIIDKHPDFDVNMIPDIVKGGEVTKDDKNRMRIELNNFVIGLKNNWRGKESNHWIVTSYSKEGDESLYTSSSSLKQAEILAYPSYDNLTTQSFKNQDTQIIAKAYEDYPSQPMSINDGFNSQLKHESLQSSPDSNPTTTELNNQDPTKDFGTNYPQFYHKGKEAIEHLLNTKEGQVQGAFYKDGLGDIDLVWGEVTNATKHTGYGLAHIIDKHPDFDVNMIPDIVKGGEVIPRHNGFNIELNDLIVGINKGFDKKHNNNWIVTGFDSKKSNKLASSVDFIESESLQSNLQANPTTQSFKNQDTQIIAKAYDEISSTGDLSQSTKQTIQSNGSNIEKIDNGIKISHPIEPISKDLEKLPEPNIPKAIITKEGFKEYDTQGVLKKELINEGNKLVEKINHNTYDIQNTLNTTTGEATTKIIPKDTNVKIELKNNLPSNSPNAKERDELQNGYVINPNTPQPQISYKNNIEALKTLKELKQSGKLPNQEQKDILNAYVGWGGLSQYFKPDNPNIEELKSLLGEHFNEVRSSVLSAYYTPYYVADNIWRAIEKMGFDRGNILEPSVGIGNFLGLMPKNIRNNVSIKGIELDTITSQIAKYLYPNASIENIGFHKIKLPQNHYNLIIGNPPYGKDQIFDEAHFDKYKKFFSIHNYFLIKSIDLLKENGLLAQVVTRNFMDNPNIEARKIIASKAELLFALRLPQNTFKDTGVSTDIVFFRKLKEGEYLSDEKKQWINLKNIPDTEGKGDIPINSYFADNPNNVLGTIGRYGGQYGADEIGIKANGDTQKQLESAMQYLSEDIHLNPQDIATNSEIESIHMMPTDSYARQNSIIQINGEFFRQNNYGEPYKIKDFELIGLDEEKYNSYKTEYKKRVDKQIATAKKIIPVLSKLRDTLMELKHKQLNPEIQESELNALRELLNKQYDSFREDFNKYINNKDIANIYDGDPTYPHLQALEKDYTPKKSDKLESAKKADIFTKRTTMPYISPNKANNIDDALLITLNEKGYIDYNRMSKLLNQSEEQVKQTLLDKALAYMDSKGNIIDKDTFLSGDIRAKIASFEGKELNNYQAKALEELKNILPPDLNPVDISFKLGANYIPKEIYERFAKDVLGAIEPYIHYTESNDLWNIKINSTNTYKEAIANNDFSTRGQYRFVGAIEVFKSIMQNKKISMHSKFNNTTLKDIRGQEALNESINKMHTAFRDYVLKNQDLSDKLARSYNDIFNSEVLREYDGSHLKFIGASESINLRPHQKNAVWRTIIEPTTLYDHTVGTGKSYTMITSAMELKRLGLANKPMIIVPNHILHQLSHSFNELYPNAYILPTLKFDKASRRRVLSSISTGDWDAVIVGHSNFSMMPMSVEYEIRFLKDTIETIDKEIKELENKGGGDSRFTIKRLEQSRQNKYNKIEKLLYSKNKNKDDVVSFEDLGVDAFFVDEAHKFKNLFFNSKLNIRGLGIPSGSEKAFDMFMKIRYLRDNNKKVIFATGTPISNTITELYTMQRYLDYEGLRDKGLLNLDQWINAFTEVSKDYEMSVAGKYKEIERIRKFVNLPELLKAYHKFGDTILNSDVKSMLALEGKDFNLPKANPISVVVKKSPLQERYMKELLERGEMIEAGQVNLSIDNFLKLTTDSQKASLDMRLIDVNSPDYPDSKINQAVQKIYDEYGKWHKDKGTQFVFIDRSTPKASKKEKQRLQKLLDDLEAGKEGAGEAIELEGGFDVVYSALNDDFNVYDDMKNKLIKKGIPQEQIAFIHDASSDKKKGELIDKVNAGEVRVLFGSTSKMGEGMNAQERAVALHHIDAPWRPSDIEQREGRIIRQGNSLYEKYGKDKFRPNIYTYATIDMLDTLMFEKLKLKADFINQIKKGNVKQRSVDDISDTSFNYAEILAQSTGDKRILEKMTLEREIRGLLASRDNYYKNNLQTQKNIAKMEDELKTKPAELKDFKDDYNAFNEAKNNGGVVSIAGKKYKRTDKNLSEALAKIEVLENNQSIYNYNGFNIELNKNKLGSELDIFANSTTTTQSYFINTIKTQSFNPQGILVRLDNFFSSDRLRLKEKQIFDLKNNLPKLKKSLKEWDNQTELENKQAKYKSLIQSMAMSANTALKDQEPVGFGTNYPQFYHKGKEAIEHLLKHKEGQVQGAFYKDGLGDIDLVWGDKSGGLSHIIHKHGLDSVYNIEDVIDNGKIFRDKYNRLGILKDNKLVAINEEYKNNKKQWVVSSYDLKDPKQYLDSAKAYATERLGKTNLPADLSHSNPTTQSFKNQDFGTNYPQFYHKGKEAIEHLLKHKEGQVQGAFYKDGLGDIDLVWGDDKMGLKHILNKHPEVIDKIPDIVKNGEIYEHNGIVKIENDSFRVGLSKGWFGKGDNNWILTAYELNESKEARRAFSTPSTITSGMNHPKNPLDSNPTTQSFKNQDTQSSDKINSHYLNSLAVVGGVSGLDIDYNNDGQKNEIDILLGGLSLIVGGKALAYLLKNQALLKNVLKHYYPHKKEVIDKAFKKEKRGIYNVAYNNKKSTIIREVWLNE